MDRDAPRTRRCGSNSLPQRSPRGAATLREQFAEQVRDTPRSPTLRGTRNGRELGSCTHFVDDDGARCPSLRKKSRARPHSRARARATRSRVNALSVGGRHVANDVVHVLVFVVAEPRSAQRFTPAARCRFASQRAELRRTRPRFGQWSLTMMRIK